MLPELQKQYIATGKAQIVYHDFAWIGEESRQAAQAARCAARQSKFWDYHDILFANQRGYNQGQFSADRLRGFATQTGLDGAAFASCLEQGADLPGIREELTAGRQNGITATPVFIINGQRFAGGTAAAFGKAIDEAAAKAGR